MRDDGHVRGEAHVQEVSTCRAEATGVGVGAKASPQLVSFIHAPATPKGTDWGTSRAE